MSAAIERDQQTRVVSWLLEDCGTLPVPYSTKKLNYRVARFEAKFDLVDGAWRFRSGEVSGPQVKKDGTDSVNHSREGLWRFDTEHSPAVDARPDRVDCGRDPMTALYLPAVLLLMAICWAVSPR